MSMKCNPNYKALMLQCECLNMDHLLEFSYYDESDEDTGKYPPSSEFYFNSGLDRGKPFFIRLVAAFKYLFNIPYRYSMFGDTVLSPSDIRDLTHFLQQYNDYIDRNNIFE